MSQAPNIDGLLITWGDRLFYPGNRIVKVKPQPKLNGDSARQRAAAIRERIESTVVHRAPQVMVKVTGGGRGMKAIAAHFRYISKNGRLDIEDERGETMRGKDTLYELADDWRFGGTLIDDIAEPGQRREAFNIMLSMPRGTDPLTVQRAARCRARKVLASAHQGAWRAAAHLRAPASGEAGSVDAELRRAAAAGVQAGRQARHPRVRRQHGGQLRLVQHPANRFNN